MTARTRAPIGDPHALRRLGDLIGDKPRIAYDQSTWWNEEPRAECGTTACIAGWAVTLIPGFTQFDYQYSARVRIGDQLRWIDDAAAEFLGLSEDVAGWLFSAGWHPAPHLEGDTLTEQVRSALYALADGASLREVSEPWEE